MGAYFGSEDWAVAMADQGWDPHLWVLAWRTTEPRPKKVGESGEQWVSEVGGEKGTGEVLQSLSRFFLAFQVVRKLAASLNLRGQ